MLRFVYNRSRPFEHIETAMVQLEATYSSVHDDFS